MRVVGCRKRGGKQSSADFPAEHTGARRLRQRTPILLVIVASTTSRVVSMIGTVLLFLVQDVAGVAVVSVATRVLEALLCRS